MKTTKRLYIIIGVIAVIFSIAYIYREEVFSFIRRQYLHIRPCTTPIRYTVGEIDTEFNISKTEVRKEIENAISIWEKPIDIDLFVYATSSLEADLHINFIYDNRQKTTVQLARINSSITTTKTMYEELNAKYKTLIKDYNADKKKLEAIIEQYQTARDLYQREVVYWNAHGGVSKQEHDRLEQSRDKLTTTQDQIIQKQQVLNSIVETINQDAVTLNSWAKDLNLNVKKYNTVGLGIEREFEEGEYVSTINTQDINIYQYSDQTKLTRVLAHELGHALGLDHIENPKAIMYKLNEGINEKLTSEDILKLKELCGIKETKK